MKIAEQFKINKYSYGYIVSQHIVGENKGKKIDRWGNNKYFGNLMQAKEYIVERFGQILFDNEEFNKFVNDVDKMEQLKNEIIALEVKKGTKGNE